MLGCSFRAFHFLAYIDDLAKRTDGIGPTDGLGGGLHVFGQAAGNDDDILGHRREFLDGEVDNLSEGDLNEIRFSPDMDMILLLGIGKVW